MGLLAVFFVTNRNVVDPGSGVFLHLDPYPGSRISFFGSGIPNQCCGTVTIYYGSGSGSGSDF